MEIIDLLDRVLDKGIVVDASGRLRLTSANLRKPDVRLVVTSIETSLEHHPPRVLARLAAPRAAAGARRRPSRIRIVSISNRRSGA